MSAELHQGFLEVDGIRVIDAGRLSAYIQHPNTGQPRPNHGWKLRSTAECVVCDEDQVDTHTYPGDPLNSAPWFDPNRRSSEEFFGINVISIVRSGGYGTDAQPSNPRPGMVEDRKQYLTIEAELVASTCEGTRYGEQWINKIFANMARNRFGATVIYREHCDIDQGAIDMPDYDAEGNFLGTYTTVQRDQVFGRRILRDVQLAAPVRCLPDRSMDCCQGGRIRIVLESAHATTHIPSRLAIEETFGAPIGTGIAAWVDPVPVNTGVTNVDIPVARIDRPVKLLRDGTWCDVEVDFDDTQCYRTVITEWEEYAGDPGLGTFGIVVWYDGVTAGPVWSWTPVNPDETLTCDKTLVVEAVYVKNEFFNSADPSCPNAWRVCAANNGMTVDAQGYLNLPTGWAAGWFTDAGPTIAQPSGAAGSYNDALGKVLDYLDCVGFNTDLQDLFSDAAAEVPTYTWMNVQTFSDGRVKVSPGPTQYSIGSCDTNTYFYEYPGLNYVGDSSCSNWGPFDRTPIPPTAFQQPGTEPDVCYEYLRKNPGSGSEGFALNLQLAVAGARPGEYVCTASWDENVDTIGDLYWELSNGHITAHGADICTAVPPPCNDIPEISLTYDIGGGGDWTAEDFTHVPEDPFPQHSGVIGFKDINAISDPCIVNIDVDGFDAEPSDDPEASPVPYRVRQGSWTPLAASGFYRQYLHLPGGPLTLHDLQWIIEIGDGSLDGTLILIYEKHEATSYSSYRDGDVPPLVHIELQGGLSGDVINLDGASAVQELTAADGTSRRVSGVVRGDRGSAFRSRPLPGGSYTVFVVAHSTVVTNSGIKLYTYERTGL